MIDAVALKLNPEMVNALLEHNQDAGIVDALESCHRDEDTGEVYLYVESEMAADWCEDWFQEADIRMVLDDDDWVYVEYPEFCADPLLKDFVQTILKIYRLTVSV